MSSLTEPKTQPLVLDMTSTPPAAGLLMSQAIRSAQTPLAAAFLKGLTSFTSWTHSAWGQLNHTPRVLRGGDRGTGQGGSAPSPKVLGLIPNVLPAAVPAPYRHGNGI